MGIWWSRHWILWILSCWRLAAGQSGLPEVEFQKTNCYPTNPVISLTQNVSPFCVSGTKIAVESLKYACPGPRSKVCSTNLSPVPGSFLEGAVGNLSGVQGAIYPVASSLCQNKRTLVELGYFCIPDSRTLQICSKKTISSKDFVYVTSSKYPNTDSVNKETNCKCSVVISKSNNSKNPSIKMVIIHAELEPTQQLTIISQGNYLLRNISKHAKQFEISVDQLQRTAFDLFLHSEANTRRGIFWVGFQSSDPASNVTVSCDEPTSSFVKPLTYPSTLFHYSVQPTPPKSSGHVPFSGHAPKPTFPTEPEDSTSDNRIWIPIVAGIVGGILLLVLILVIIVCVAKKNRSPREKVAPKFGEQPRYQSKTATINRGPTNTYRSPTPAPIFLRPSNTTYSSPRLPPLTGATVGGAQRSESPRRIIHKKNKKTQAMFDDVATRDETKKKKRRRKKPKRWTDVITDQSGETTEDTASPRRSLRTSEFRMDVK